MKWYSELVVQCDEFVGRDKSTGMRVRCPNTIHVPNPDMVAPYRLWGEAELQGWFLSGDGLGDLCPTHHKKAAEKIGWASLRQAPQARPRPIRE